MLLGSLPACENSVWENSLLKNSTSEVDDHITVDDEMVGGQHEQTRIFKVFFKWLLDGGAKFPLLYLHFFSGNYRAIFAKRTVEMDEDVLYVPLCQLMTSEIARASKVGRQIREAGLQLRSRHSFLAAYLLQEKAKPSSYWKPYIDILPEEYDTIPLFFNDEQRSELEGSMSLDKIRDRHQSLRMEYNNLLDNVAMFSEFTYESFVWARLVVITRIFGMVIDGEKTEGLVPMADMLNHKRPRETKWTYVQNCKGFVITSLNPIYKGCEVFDSYGRKCNSRFFVNYGFVPEVNEDNEAVMRISLDPEDAAYEDKCVLGSRFDLSCTKTFQIPMQYDDPNNKVQQAFSYARFIASSKEEVEKHFQHYSSTITDVLPISLTNEARVLQLFADAAQEALSAFPHSFEHDMELLKDLKEYPLLSNKRNIVLMRSGEKRVLLHFIELNSTIGPVLKKLAADPKAEVTFCNKIGGIDLACYVNAVKRRLCV